MDYVRSLSLSEENLLSSKASKDKTTVQAMLDVKIGQYLADVRREAGQDVDAEIAKKLAGKSMAEKQVILGTL